MSTLVDTGVLLRLFDRADPNFSSVRGAVEFVRQQGPLATTHQNIAEFWNVTTRPVASRGGYGFSPSKVELRIRFIERKFQVLTETPNSYSVWRGLVRRHSLVGTKVHDARLASIVISERLGRLLTLNPGDFRRYAADGVSVVTPREILTAS